MNIALRKGEAMIKKQEKTVTFADVWLSHTEKKWAKHWLKTVLDKVNFEKFRYRFEKLYDENNGRPAWDPILLFKALLLAQWNNLSDRQLEETLNDRISFRKFVGLKWEEESPDATTFSFFRERITPIMDKLLRILNKQLEEAGFKIDEVVAIDATLVEAHSKPRGEDFAGDPEASWRGFPTKEIIDVNGNKTVARRSALYGYKVNMSSSVKTGFISDLSVCKASEHEVHHFDELIKGKATKAVYADKGYCGKKKSIKALGIKDFIQDKGARNRPLTEAQVRRNKNISSVRVISESNFGGFKLWYGWKKTKYVGLIKNTLAAVITAVCWNIKKWAVLYGYVRPACLPPACRQGRDRQAFSSA